MKSATDRLEAANEVAQACREAAQAYNYFVEAAGQENRDLLDLLTMALTSAENDREDMFKKLRPEIEATFAAHCALCAKGTRMAPDALVAGEDSTGYHDCDGRNECGARHERRILAGFVRMPRSRR